MITKFLKNSVSWRKGFQLALEVHKLTQKFPKTETYELGSQMRRCAMSIPSNISEGTMRISPNELQYFLRIARGSCGELQTQLLLVYKLGYVDKEIVENLLSQLTEIIKILNASIKTLRKKSNTT